ncbi:MAG TPA: DUF4388 domain-containing protein [Pyrinomonadaceae bacterium]
MNGQLNEHPLAELIREITAEGLSGALRLSRERAKGVIYFDSGEIIYAASNLRAYRLPECIRRWGTLTEQQLARAQGKASDQEFGAALVETGQLSRDLLADLVAHQVSELLCHVLLWTEGEWEFDPRVRLSDETRSRIKSLELLTETARRLPAEFVAARFSDGGEKLSPEAGAVDGLNLLPSEAFVLSRIEAPMSLDELLAIAGLPEPETLRIVYTLALGGALVREKWPRAFTEDEIARARAVKAATPTPAAPVLKAQERATAKGSESAPVAERDEKEELDDLFKRLDRAANYYQILGVVRPANDADIKRAYHGLARRFHPDRFRKTVDDALHNRIESAFAQIAQAYEILKDKTSRATYDSTLFKKEESARTVPADWTMNRSNNANNTSRENFARANPAASQTQAARATSQAEEKFKEGLAALQSGNGASAIACLSEAARLVPTQPRYRAHYGQALAGDERLRRNAEAELKAAISLDAKNATYRVMLAELYSELGMVRRAQGEIARALSIDPQNEAARRLFLKLRG